MESIEITQFEGYDLDEFKEFLEIKNTSEFEIIIPKETMLFYSTNDDVGWEFGIAAYIGERLHKIADEFSYNGDKLTVVGKFCFKIKTAKIGDLAGLLLDISSAFGNDEIIEPIDFASEVAGFLEDYKNKPVFCQDFFDIACEYRGNGDEDED